MRVLATGTVMVDVMAVGLPAVAEPGEVIYTAVESHIGGHPVDVAIDLVRLGKDPESVAVAAAVGKGPFGSFVRSVMDGYNIQTFLQDVTTTDTGRNLVLAVAGEDRRFHLDPGANWELSAAHVASAVATFKPDLLTLRPGYSGIDLDLHEVLDPLDGTLIMLDIMQPHPERPAGFIRSIMPNVDVLHCNEREALINTAASTLEEAVDAFLSAGVKVVLVTGGEHGASGFTGRWQVSQEGFHVDTVDATGCGDAFCAGVILYLEEANPPELEDLEPQHLTELLISAQATGAAAATAAGCVAGVSSGARDQILAGQSEAILRTTQTTNRQGRRT
jgi:sugar/nucleoside kinase (ribokinase family)